MTKKWLIPWIIAIAMFIETLDSTIVGVAIPAIADSFQINPVSMKLALTGYLVSLAIFIPISGWLADRFSEKKVFISAMVFFTFSSILCALSYNLVLLISARILQGLGGALMMPVGRLIVLRTFHRAELSKAMSLVVIPGLLGPALGPTVGGLILQVASWHWIFLVNVPLGIIGAIVAYFYISPGSRISSSPFNWWGFTFFSTGLATLTFSMALLSDTFDRLLESSVLAFLSFLLLSAYWLLSRCQVYPLFDMDLFKQKNFRIAIIVSLITRPSLGAILFLLPLLLQVVWQKTALYSGLAFMFFALGMMSARFAVKNSLLCHWGYKKILYVTIITMTFLSMMLGLFIRPQPFYLLASVLFVLGIMNSQFFLTINSLTVIDLDPQNFSQSTSISSTIQQFSAGLGIALAAIFLHLLSYLLQIPLFSGSVFLGCFIALNSINFLSLFFIRNLDGNLKPLNFALKANSG